MTTIQNNSSKQNLSIFFRIHALQRASANASILVIDSISIPQHALMNAISNVRGLVTHYTAASMVLTSESLIRGNVHQLVNMDANIYVLDGYFSANSLNKTVKKLVRIHVNVSTKKAILQFRNNQHPNAS